MEGNAGGKCLMLLVVNNLLSLLHHRLSRVRSLVAHVLQSFGGRPVKRAAVQEDTDHLRETHTADKEVYSCKPTE